MVAEYLKNGISTIVEQGMSAAEITTLETIAKNHDANFFVYRIEASNETRIKRIQERATRTNQPMMSQETMNTLSEIYENNAYPATGTFNSEKMTIKEIAEQILKDIGARKNQ